MEEEDDDLEDDDESNDDMEDETDDYESPATPDVESVEGEVIMLIFCDVKIIFTSLQGRMLNTIVSCKPWTCMGIKG